MEYTLENIINTLPKNTSKIISDITQKYNLVETPEEFKTKMLHEGIAGLNVRKLLVFCIKAMAGKIEKNDKEMASVLKKELNIDNKKAQLIAKELEEKILSQADPSRPASVIEKPAKNLKNPNKSVSDSYREQVT
ncbi:MAG: hypothetical protein Q8N55_04620 [bacterium]|nr:hypothetical protein [bacterium]